MFKYHHRICHLPDKIPVMGHKQNRSLIGTKRGFQRFLCPDIHMVGGLVQNQEIGAALQKLRQHQSCLLSTGKRADLLLRVPSAKQICAKDASGLLLRQSRKLGRKMLQNSLLRLDGPAVLIEITNGGLISQRITPFQRRQETGYGL